MGFVTGGCCGTLEGVVEAPLNFVRPREPKPEWLKVRAPGSDNYLRLRSIMRGPGYADTDLMLGRIFPITKEQVRMQFRAELFNAFNRVNFRTIPGNGAPAFTDVNNPNFGKLLINGAQDPRIMQFGLKFLF